MKGRRPLQRPIALIDTLLQVSEPSSGAYFAVGTSISSESRGLKIDYAVADGLDSRSEILVTDLEWEGRVGRTQCGLQKCRQLRS